MPPRTPGANRTTRAIRGDYQTPPVLAEAVCAHLRQQGVTPAAVLEPSCGTGTFLAAAARAFPSAQVLVGVELNPEYVRAASSSMCSLEDDRVKVLQGDFFSFDWTALLATLPRPLLVLGNPPWVTTSTLGSLRGANRPERRNLAHQRGIDAVTGHGNFDISLYMIERSMTWLSPNDGTLAMLCKRTVARKALLHAWHEQGTRWPATIVHIDAPTHFGASVAACLLTIESQADGPRVCQVYDSLEDDTPAATIGLVDGTLVSDLEGWKQTRHLTIPSDLWPRGDTNAPLPRWRSGIKHDAARVMVLTRQHGRYGNGFGEEVDIEPTHLFPLLRGGDLASGRTASSNQCLVVPQSHPGEDTSHLETTAPRTWAYLAAHRPLLDKRSSRIYRAGPPFAIFGVGAYTFEPFKVAVSALHKNPVFRAVGPVDGKPVVFDDTCYFLPCESREQAERLTAFLNSDPVRLFLRARRFEDEKRSVTADLLNSLHPPE